MKVSRVAIAGLLVVVIGGAVAYVQMSQTGDQLPEGFVQGNGRIEAEQVEIAPKTAGRVDRILAAEGELVADGALLVEMDTDELEAAFDQAKANVALARQTKAEAEAFVLQRQSELRLASQEYERARSLLASEHMPESVFEKRETTLRVAEAVLGATEARVKTADSQITASR